MEEHIRYLCLLFEIEWDNTSPLRRSRATVPRSIHTAPIHGQVQYLTALHEVAHVILGHISSSGFETWTEDEAEAWNWALDESIVKLNPGCKWDIYKLIEDHRVMGLYFKGSQPGVQYHRLIERLDV